MQALSDWIKEIKNDPNISTLNEAQAKRSVIERILEFLGWDIYNYNEVKLEHGVGTRRVDYALRITGANEVFIEAKKPGEELENHQEQLLDYSFKEGVDLAILTNGIAWWFYLPLKKGVWKNRKFYTIDILVQETEVIVKKFGCFLSRENVASGEAVRQAESILERSQRDKIIKERLPEAWNKVIKNAVSPDSLLVDLLAETAEEVCGFKLENDEILGFIRSHHEKWLLSLEGPIIPPPPPPPGRWMSIDNEIYELKYIKEILVNTANWLIDKGHLKHADCPIKISPRAKTRFLINSTPTHLTGGKFIGEEKLKNGLYIETHVNTKQTIEYAKKLLKKYGYDPEILKIEY